MKATNNTDTLFMDIFVELYAIAKVYFEELFKNADPGTYTIKDIYTFIEKNIEATKQGKLTGVSSYFSDRYVKTLEKSPYYTKVDSFEKYTISYLCRVTDNIVSIEKENFKCSFDIIKVFEYLERFKKLSGAKDKLEFTKEVEVKEGQKSTSFEIELSKEDIKSLIFVKTEKKDIVGRYTENTAHLSLTDSTIYATDCFVLKAKRVDVKNVLGETKDILIPFDVLKNIGAGKCEFTVIEEKQKFEYEEEKTIYKVAVKNTATNKIVSYSFKKVERFYNYKSIYPELYKEMNICLKDTKSFADCIKTQQKLCKEFGLFYFMIQVIKGSKKIKVITCNEVYDINDDYKFSEFSFELKESSKFSGNYFYSFNTVLKCLDDWNGNLYFDEIKLSFETEAVDTCFCVSTQDSDKYFDKYSIVTIKPDKLTKIKNDIALEQKSNDNIPLDNCDKQNKNHLDAIYKDTPKEGDYVEFNLSCNADAPTYIGFVSNDPDLGLVCVVDGQKIEVREMINLKVLKQEESKTVPPTQSGKESALNDKERSKAKETKPTMQYTDDMLELVSLDLDSMTYTVNGDVGTEKDIASIVLYDKIGKIVVYCDDGEKIECQFDGESVLQSVLKEM